jgi:pentatricopeptide repeat protein
VNKHLLPSLLVLTENSPTAATYSALLQNAVGLSTPEHAVQILRDMLDRDFTPDPSIVHRTLELCCEWALPRLAMQLAHRIEQSSTVRIDVSSWSQILICSAENQFVSIPGDPANSSLTVSSTRGPELSSPRLIYLTKVYFSVSWT